MLVVQHVYYYLLQILLSQVVLEDHQTLETVRSDMVVLILEHLQKQSFRVGNLTNQSLFLNHLWNSTTESLVPFPPSLLP